MPAKLAFIIQPGGAVAGSALSNQPAVAVQDASGNTINSSITSVKLTVTSGSGAAGANLFGPSTVNAVGGVARFNNLFMDKAGTDYTLTATSVALTPATSSPFSISPGAPAKLAYTIQPSDGTVGSPLPKQPEVIVQDHYGNTVAGYDGAVTLAILIGTGPGDAVVLGTATVRVVNSAARFTDISVSRSNPLGFKLTATSDSLEPAESQPFSMTAGAAVKLEFTVQPAGAKAGSPFETQPKVAIEDQYGNVVVASKAAITVSLTPGIGTTGAVLSGNKILAAEGGMGGGLAEFTDLSIDKAGSGYTLTATCSSLTAATSQAFNVGAQPGK